jgi:tellurite resistance protein TerC
MEGGGGPVTSVLSWGIFLAFIIILLTIDLVVFNRRPHEISIKESLIWSAGWILIALGFNVGVYFWLGHDAALQFLTGYLVEKSLSIDNLFVFLLLFTYFKVPPKYQHKVLYWGILGALVMRGLLILVGSALIAKFHWILYIFGIFLVITGIRMAFESDGSEVHPERNVVVKFFRRIFRVTPEYHEDRFFVKVDGKVHATLLCVVLIVVETTDLVFAVDSIPAVFAVSRDPFIIFTSNVFAILGLRSLYFALAGMLSMFYYLRLGLAVVLTFVGVKMLCEPVLDVPISIALGVVGGVLLIAILASIIRTRRMDGREHRT